MSKNAEDGLAESLIDKNAKERFSKPLFSIVVGMHAVAAIGLFWMNPWYILAWFVAHMWFSTVGLSLGLHRLYSHRSFVAVPVVDKIIAISAALCFQGSPTYWAAAHRVHHVLTEAYGDPYSAKRGFWWSHLFWMFYSNPNGFSYSKARRLVPDLKRNKLLAWLEFNATAFNVSCLVVLFLVCYLSGHVGLFFWLGPIRIVSVWHATWLINSYAHYAPFLGSKVGSRMRNSWLLSLALGGEGDHAYHHQHPSHVRHAEARLNLDSGYLMLRVLKVLGLVSFRPPSE